MAAVLDELAMWALFGCALMIPGEPASQVIALIVFAAFSRLSDGAARASLARSGIAVVTNRQLVEVLRQADHERIDAIEEEVKASHDALLTAKRQLTRESSFHVIRYYLAVVAAVVIVFGDS